MIQVHAVPVPTDSDPNQRYADTFILLKKSRNDHAADYRRAFSIQHITYLACAPVLGF